MPLSQLKTAANSGPVIISQTIIQPAKRTANSATNHQTHQQQQQQQHTHIQQQQQQPTLQQSVSTSTTPTQYVLTTSATQPQQQQQQQLQTATMPTLTSFARTTQQNTTTLYQSAASTNSQTPTKILLKTSPSGVMMTPVRQQQASNASSGNPPPLIATSTTQQQQQQPTLLNIQNVQLPNRPVTIQPASQAAQQQHMQAQLQQQQPQHTIVSNTSATQQPKLTQVLVQSTNPAGVGGTVGNVGGVNVANTNANMKNKTIILTQKGVILRNIGGDMYQQIPISNMSGLQGLNTSAGTTLMTTTGGPPSLVKTTPTGVQTAQTIQLQQQSGNQAKQQQHIPTLIPTNTLSSQHMIVQQPAQRNLINTVSATRLRKSSSRFMV